MKKVELLSPAGNLEKLKVAFAFGADAVYVGGKAFNLRAKSHNFAISELEEAVKIARRLNKKVFLTLNAYVKESKFSKVLSFVDSVKHIPVSGVIVSDPGLIEVVLKNFSHADVHLSTQANTLNSASVNFWFKNGVKRFILGRELSLDDIRKIKQKVPEAELEVFIHGAMCVSYSGRCLLSAVMTGRSANEGDCAQSCRWKYYLVEETRKNEAYPIFSTEEGTFILNSKDLKTLDFLDEIIKSGVDALKIEGRMKSVYYTAIVTGVYRKAIDLFYENPDSYKALPELEYELENISHRPYYPGFFKGNDNVGVYPESSKYLQQKKLLGIFGKRNGTTFLKVKNRIKPDTKTEIVTPGLKVIKNHNLFIESNSPGKEIPLPREYNEIPEFSILREA